MVMMVALFVQFLAVVFSQVAATAGIKDLTATADTNEPTVIVSFNASYTMKFEPPPFGPITKYVLGYAKTPITEANWDAVPHREESRVLGGVAVNYFRVPNLELGATYYFAVRAWSATLGYSDIATVTATTTDRVRSWSYPNIASMEDDSWLDLAPAPGPGGTSQVISEYSAVLDKLVFWGGHPPGGGYPQTDKLFTYAPGDSGWKLEDLNYRDTTTPIGGCDARGFIPGDNTLAVVSRQQAQRYEWFRSGAVMGDVTTALEQGPWLYDFGDHRWTMLATLGWQGLTKTSPPRISAWSADHGIQFLARAVMNGQDRYVLFDPYLNQIWVLHNSSWTDDAGHNSEARLNTALVYDSRRRQFVWFQAALMSADWGPMKFVTDCWYLPLSIDRSTWKDHTAWIKWLEIAGMHAAASTRTFASAIAVANPAEVLPSSGNRFMWEVTACYDSIHDKFLVFVLAGNCSTNLVDDSRKIQTYIYDPVANTWERGNDQPGYARGHRQGDLHASFSEKHNCAFVVDAGRLQTEPINSKTWAYRYSTKLGTPPVPVPPARNYPRYVREGYVVVASPTDVTIHWTPRDAVAGYNVYRAEVAATKYVKDAPIPGGRMDLNVCLRDNVIKSIVPPTSKGQFVKVNASLITDSWFRDPNVDLSGGTGYAWHVYVYCVEPISASGAVGGWSPFWATFPQAPTMLSVTKSATNYDLSWQAPHHGEGIAGYRVYVADQEYVTREITTEMVRGLSYSASKVGVATINNHWYVTAIDSLGQEGAASGGAWGDYQYAAYYAQYRPAQPPGGAPISPARLRIR